MMECREKQNRQRMRKILSYILSYLLSLIFVCILFIAGVFTGILNSDAILHSIEKSNYYSNIYAEVIDTADSMLLSAGVDSSFLGQVFTKEHVYEDQKKIIETAFLQKKIVFPETQIIQQHLQENIQTYARKKDLLYGKEQRVEVKELCKTVSEEYRKLLNFPLLIYYIKYKAVGVKLMLIMIPILCFIGTAISITLFRINRKRYKAFQYVAYSDLAAVIILTLLPAYILLTKPYQNLNVSPKYFYDFIMTYIQRGLTVFLYIGGAGMALFAVLVLLIETQKLQLPVPENCLHMAGNSYNSDRNQEKNI